MDHLSEDNELVRSVGSPSADEENLEKNTILIDDGDAGKGVADGNGDTEAGDDTLDGENGEDDADLPQCKIKRNYSCNLCPFFSQNPRSYLYHSRDVHFDRIKIYECSQCLYASKHSQKLQRHINMIHMPGKTRKIRNRMIRPDRKELRPIRPKPPNLSPEVPLKVFTLLTEEQKLKVETDHGDEPEKTSSGEFKCSACNFKHKNPKLLRRHERLVHLKKRYLKCNKCSYVTHVTARFTKHVKYHSMPMIKCDLCDFRTPYKWNLDRHYKNHSGSGAFQCAKCNFRADIKQSLTVHEMNHHVPPVGQGAAIAWRKNKVGSSEVPNSDLNETNKRKMGVLNLEKKDSDLGIAKEVESREEKKIGKAANLQNLRNVKLPYNNKREAANNNHLQTDFIHPDDIVPRYGQIFVKNLKCKFCSYKAVFSHEIWRHEKRIHGYVRPENKKDIPSKRPPPQLIPIQNKPSSNAILKIPSVRNKPVLPSPEGTPVDKPVNETEFNEMCKKSSLTSSLKDFVSLIGDEEGLKTIPDSSTEEDLEATCSGWVSEPSENSDNKNDDLVKQKQTDLLKKKNASFFDKLKENLLTGNNETQSLFCDVCGHESKCLSESVAHQKKHSDTNFKENSDGPAENDVVLSGSGLSSTRCQHCRQRCKTSTDLINHLKYCKAFEASLDSQGNSDDVDEISIKTEEVSFESESDAKVEGDGSSMENRVFVWNDMSRVHNEEAEGGEEEDEDEEEQEVVEVDPEGSLNKKPGVTSPGVGTVTSKGSDNTESGTVVMKADPRLHVTVKKVFKCPHCSFWASTASRFHVHIVGHLNKKPFECSLCLYRSNWRWDITKHIRLKSLRDPTHSAAKVNMTDETGRRNYSKYNRFLTMMRVQEPTAESSGYGRRSRNGDLTQGTVTDKDIIPFPAPPRLTRAPVLKTSPQVPQGIPLRPPPPLKAAHHIPPQSSLLKQSKDSVKKTFWKCKKCNFRDSQKGRVLLHVKKHYMSKKNENGFRANTSGSFDEAGLDVSADRLESELKSLLKSPSYSCGHCHQVSNWKHVIQRHCKLKHNGDALIEINWKEEESKPCDVEDNRGDREENFSCDICPFTTDSEGDLTAHKLNHIDRPGSIFKCTYCPFYVPSKIAVLEHMEIHGILEGTDLTSLKVDNFDPNEELIPQNCGSPGEASKKYKCLQCPYLSNSRTQFLYHKQFHRPRNAPFKCLYCTYNVSRRHLLHQHLRVHHNRDKKNCNGADQTQTSKESETTEEINLSQKLTENEGKQVTEKHAEQQKDVIGVHTPKIPLVWVLKSGNIQKMFKCRWCPHVNSRKSNVQDHEKMHQSNESEVSNEEPKLQCSDCNYSCNSSGVLASHVKVHQGFFGEIQSAVDPTRPESEQIQELQNSLKATKQEVVVVESNGLEEDVEGSELLSSQPENAYSRTTRVENPEGNEECKKILSFCDKCPARFFYKKELRIHSKFHMIHLPFRCSYCSYTARQRPHLLAHYKIHSQEYREKTQNLMETYAISPEHPQLKTVIISKGSYVTEGPVWVIKSWESKSELKALPKYACHLCPATFFKSNAHQYHLTLHGGSYKFRCKYCNYAVKTRGNLSKHLLVHEKQSKEKHSKKAKFSYSFPISGKDLFQSTEEKKTVKEKKSEKTKVKDSEFETLMQGSPEFIYPTYMTGGKVREKKYKCPKCPTAFSKVQQYRVHLSLHGSKQTYECERCDYSVNFYQIFIQHRRRHEKHDEVIKTKKLIDTNKEVATETSVKNHQNDDDKKPYELSLSEKQTLLLQERKKSFENREEDRKSYFCGYCPYSSNRRDLIENHSWRHYLVSGIKSGFECSHCDYSATQNSFLREHVKLHFNNVSRYKVEAYLKCEKMELWCCEKDAKDPRQILIFQDRGDDSKTNRYFPPVEKFDSDRDDRVLRNRAGKKPSELYKETEESQDCSDEVDSPRNDDLIEMIEEQVEEVEVDQIKPKRCRGKNWRCKKCPHAFGKRDQYLRHVSLHGSNQRHNCDICDYSVKFYTNYVQHMRMHQMHEPDRVIRVKKNIQSLMESAQRLLAASLVEESDSPPSKKQKQNAEFECGFETLNDNKNDDGGDDDDDDEDDDDDVDSHYSEKLVIDENDDENKNSPSRED